MKSDRVLIAAITGITIIEVVALLKGIDGALLTIVVAALAGLGGLMMKQPKFIQK